MENYIYSNYKITSNNRKNNANKRRLQRIQNILGSYNGALKAYIYGVLHPEIAINSSNIPKCPNYVSIPTSNITFREAFDILPDKDGAFLLYWTPNFLCTTEGIRQRVGGNGLSYSRNWIGGFDNDMNMFGFLPVAAFTPPASFKKYRLVSAGCKITYKGALINRAGIISHCLSYRSIPMPFFDASNPSDYTTNGFIPANQTLAHQDVFGEMEDIPTTIVQNGMWNGVKNIQKDASVFVVAVPTDPADFIFEDDSFFYAAATQETRVTGKTLTWNDGNNQAHASVYYTQQPEDGTPCSYIFRGEGLSDDDRLYVEQFYNFEIIPTESSASILRPRLGLSKDSIDKAFDAITKAMNITKGQSVSQKVIEDIIKTNTKGSQALKEYDKTMANVDTLLKNLRRKEVGTIPVKKVVVEPQVVKENKPLKILTKPKDIIKVNTYNPITKAKQNLKEWANIGKSLYKNSDKVINAAMTIQRWYQLLKGSGKFGK